MCSKLLQVISQAYSQPDKEGTIGVWSGVVHCLHLRVLLCQALQLTVTLQVVIVAAYVRQP